MRTAANAAAVLEAYGFPKDASESAIVARLFKMYQELTEKKYYLRSYPTPISITSQRTFHLN
jgi:hypothetical protein